jgi:hypothetical protein
MNKMAPRNDKKRMRNKERKNYPKHDKKDNQELSRG